VYFDAWFPHQHCCHNRIAELADYLQADELTHELVSWGHEAVARIGKFWSEDAKPQDVHFTFLRSGTG
jgi:hypothetical protein